VKHTLRSFAVGAVVLATGAVGAVVLAAGAVGAPAPPQTTSAAASVLQQPTFRASVDLVTTDVIVRDGRGRFDPSLTAQDFQVFEDGVPQKIASLVLVHGGRTISRLQPAAPAPAREGVIVPPAAPPPDMAGRIFILFVDDLHLDYAATGRLRDLFRKIRTELIHPGDRFAIVSTGPSSLAIDLTYDEKVIDQAMARISGAGLRPSDILQGGETSEGPSEVRYRAHVAFSTAYELMQKLDAIHSVRKILIYISSGYDFDPFGSSRAKAGQTTGRSGSLPQGDATDLWSRQGRQFADADLARELADLTRQANRANVTIDTIDPRGLVAGPDISEPVDPTEWQDYLRKSKDSLRVLSEETGGVAVVDRNDFDRALKQIDAATSDYYMLGYSSSNPDPLKRTRRIEVKVSRRGLRVWYRASYALKPGR
jgi:VWFA-related protein